MTDTTVSLITSIVTLITVLANAYLVQRTKRQVSDVHELVNDKSETQENRIDQLTESIQGTTPPGTVPPKTKRT